jgi:hypothetical protein
MIFHLVEYCLHYRHFWQLYRDSPLSTCRATAGTDTACDGGCSTHLHEVTTALSDRFFFWRSHGISTYESAQPGKALAILRDLNVSPMQPSLSQVTSEADIPTNSDKLAGQ